MNCFRACMRPSRFRRANAKRYLTIPRAAVTFNPYGETVYIVEEKGTAKDGKPSLSVRQTFITLGPARGDQVAILKGIKEGERVVTSGQLKLKSGSPGGDQQSRCSRPMTPILLLQSRNGETTIMKFTDIFIKRPVLATVLSLLILVLGLRSINLLPVREYPKTQNAVVTVTTVYTGADPELVSGFITTPLENSIAQANGIDYLTSSSTQSVSTITANMRLNYDANVALSEINTKVNAVLNQLPKACAAAGDHVFPPAKISAP